jgi:hypothetical protein
LRIASHPSKVHRVPRAPPDRPELELPDPLARPALKGQRDHLLDRRAQQERPGPLDPLAQQALLVFRERQEQLVQRGQPARQVPRVLLGQVAPPEPLDRLGQLAQLVQRGQQARQGLQAQRAPLDQLVRLAPQARRVPLDPLESQVPLDLPARQELEQQVPLDRLVPQVLQGRPDLPARLAQQDQLERPAQREQLALRVSRVLLDRPALPVVVRQDLQAQ